jgi:hypothetical protein
MAAVSLPASCCAAVRRRLPAACRAARWDLPGTLQRSRSRSRARGLVGLAPCRPTLRASPHECRARECVLCYVSKGSPLRAASWLANANPHGCWDRRLGPDRDSTRPKRLVCRADPRADGLASPGPAGRARRARDFLLALGVPHIFPGFPLTMPLCRYMPPEMSTGCVHSTPEADFRDAEGGTS